MWITRHITPAGKAKEHVVALFSALIIPFILDVWIGESISQDIHTRVRLVR